MEPMEITFKENATDPDMVEVILKTHPDDKGGLFAVGRVECFNFGLQKELSDKGRINFKLIRKRS